MTYNLFFHPLALKEWKKLASSVQQQFKTALQKNVNKEQSQIHGILEHPL